MRISNPVLLKELRGRMRGKRAFAILTVYLALLALVVGGMYLIFRAAGPVSTVQDRQVFGKALFGLVVWLELLTVGFVAPALTAGAIASERERQTFDLLRTTLLSARSLVTGKFLAGWVFLLLLLVAALPLQSLAFLFGGIAPEEVAIATLVLVVTSFTFCAVGLYFSSFLDRALVSTVLSYTFAILLVFGLPVLALTLFGLANSITGGLFDQITPAQEAMLYIGGLILASTNPLATVAITETVLLTMQSSTLFQVSLSNGSPLTLISPWIPFTILHLLLSALLLLLSVRFVKRREK